MVSFNELAFIDDESNDDGSGSRSTGTCNFPFCYGKPVGSVGETVGRVCGVGSGVLVPTGIELIGDVFPLVVFIPRGVEFKGGQLVELFWRSKS